MMAAASKAGGDCMGVPDTCLTPAPPGPPVPMPYPNMAQLATADGVVDTVLIENKETVVEGSKMPNSKGDEGGTNGGVMSGVNMGPVEPKLFSSKVFFAGKKATFLTAMTAHNGTSANLPGGTIVSPSQMKVFVAP
jgi:hypothetical protein